MRSISPIRNAPEARYTNQHCRPLHQYRRASSSQKESTTDRDSEVAMYDLISRMLDYDPTLRITLKEALRHHYFDGEAATTTAATAASNDNDKENVVGLSSAIDGSSSRRFNGTR